MTPVLRVQRRVDSLRLEDTFGLLSPFEYTAGAVATVLRLFLSKFTASSAPLKLVARREP